MGVSSTVGQQIWQQEEKEVEELKPA